MRRYLLIEFVNMSTTVIDTETDSVKDKGDSKE